VALNTIILTLILLENEAHFFKINETLTITCYREPVLTTITVYNGNSYTE
jgi:hypothetical protein